jgi:hypothetical protein
METRASKRFANVRPNHPCLPRPRVTTTGAVHSILPAQFDDSQMRVVRPSETASAEPFCVMMSIFSPWLTAREASASESCPLDARPGTHQLLEVFARLCSRPPAFLGQCFAQGSRLRRCRCGQANLQGRQHTAATTAGPRDGSRRILASSNTPPGTVHRILGHANFATTMKLFGGLTAEALDKAAGALGDAFEPKPEVKRS